MEAQKHIDPTDPDLNPQHCVSLKVFLGPLQCVCLVLFPFELTHCLRCVVDRKYLFRMRIRIQHFRLFCGPACQFIADLVFQVVSHPSWIPDPTRKLGQVSFLFF
jgi:hypothetical protein